MRTEVLTIDTSTTRTLDVTGLAERFLASESGDGLLHVFVPHATAGVALIETGSGTECDLEATIERLLPREDIYAHSHGSKGHGGDHVLPAFVGPSLTVPVIAGRMTLGTWQSIVVVDPNRDNPERQLRLSFLAA
jgi:secondary thiamine-phosphate synthase enzyme